jgi:hypothetical protein
MGESSFDVFCPQCNILVEAKVIAKGHGEFCGNPVSSISIDEVDTEYRVLGFGLFLVCGGVFSIGVHFSLAFPPVSV